MQVEDGPNDEGEMFTRPGRLADKLPIPYANEQAARYSNGGAYPPDLSLISGARHNGQNYIFALLTGYRDPPAGITMREGLYYNPYFPGGAIAMPKMLVDGGAEYDDGTPASASQQAKDVVTFLTWSCYPWQDEMRIMGIKACFVITLMIGACVRAHVAGLGFCGWLEGREGHCNRAALWVFRLPHCLTQSSPALFSPCARPSLAQVLLLTPRGSDGRPSSRSASSWMW